VLKRPGSLGGSAPPNPGHCAFENDELIHEAPAIIGRQTSAALAYADDD
jgi:hypothetical protein